ncbi:hypothetical protein [Bacillus smithii]|nr:hypothetical protein [Bacillus smithii]
MLFAVKLLFYSQDARTDGLDFWNHNCQSEGKTIITTKQERIPMGMIVAAGHANPDYCASQEEVQALVKQIFSGYPPVDRMLKVFQNPWC